MKKNLKKILMLTYMMVMMLTAAMPVQAATKTMKKVLYTNSTFFVGGYSNAKWTSSNKKVVTVSKKGEMRAVKPGKSTVTAKRGKKIILKVQITIKKKPVLNYTSRSLYAGKTVTLKVTNAPGKVSWNSSNKAVVTVSKNGKVTAKKAGKAIITAKSGDWEGRCSVTVMPESQKNMTIRQLAGRADENLLRAFELLKFQLIIDGNVNYSGYFTAKGQSITLKEADNTVYHELGHLLGWVSNYADTRAEWKNIYAKEKGLVTSFNKAYVTQNASEYFAESYRDYVLNKNTLRSSRPLTFQYIEKALSDLHDMPESRFARMHDSYAKAGIWKN